MHSSLKLFHFLLHYYTVTLFFCSNYGFPVAATCPLLSPNLCLMVEAVTKTEICVCSESWKNYNRYFLISLHCWRVIWPETCTRSYLLLLVTCLICLTFYLTLVVLRNLCVKSAIGILAHMWPGRHLSPTMCETVDGMPRRNFLPF